MKPLRDPTHSRPSPVCCHVTASAVVRVSVESLPELRRNPGSVGGRPLPASFLKHADEQTVAGLRAVFQALQHHQLQSVSFQDWGVIAAPRFLGRPAMAGALQRFMAEGAWGVSPHLIPHRSLHSISGTVSQALQIRGPNFGVGGGPNGVTEALLSAMAMLACKRLPGIWVVLTCLDPELSPDQTGRIAAGTHCVGMALALSSTIEGPSSLRLQVKTIPESGNQAHRSPDDFARLEMALKSMQGLVQLETVGCLIELTQGVCAETNGHNGRLLVGNGAECGMLMSANGAERR